MMREVKTRFGNSPMGYFWTIAEPCLQVILLGVIFSLIDKKSIAHVHVALFLFVAILPFQFIFKKMLNQVSAAMSANKSLLSYKQIHPMDPIISRILLELAVFCICCILIFTFMYWLGLDAVPQDILSLIACYILLAFFSTGLGLMICVGETYYADLQKITGLLTRPLFFISGIFFVATSIPQQYWYLFTWNPVFHVMELSRESFFDVYTSPVASWFYLIFCSICSLGIGLTLFHVNRFRFLLK